MTFFLNLNASPKLLSIHPRKTLPVNLPPKLAPAQEHDLRLELAGNATLRYYPSEEAKEGQNACLEKRQPGFPPFP